MINTYLKSMEKNAESAATVRKSIFSLPDKIFRNIGSIGVIAEHSHCFMFKCTYSGQVRL